MYKEDVEIWSYNKIWFSTLTPCNFQNVILEELQIFLHRIHKVTDGTSLTNLATLSAYCDILCMRMLFDSYAVVKLSLCYCILFMFHQQSVIGAYSFLVVRISLRMTCNILIQRMTLLSICNAEKTYEWSSALSFWYVGGWGECKSWKARPK